MLKSQNIKNSNKIQICKKKIKKIIKMLQIISNHLLYNKKQSTMN